MKHKMKATRNVPFVTKTVMKMTEQPLVQVCKSNIEHGYLGGISESLMYRVSLPASILLVALKANETLHRSCRRLASDPRTRSHARTMLSMALILCTKCKLLSTLTFCNATFIYSTFLLPPHTSELSALHGGLPSVKYRMTLS